ncbi:MAG TPA: hypothetical protein VL283_03525 [Candidatus Baltobacteraceae bacterium]|nr:hypothetical protein [Candidatus Baltobacteraceae bacterium]
MAETRHEGLTLGAFLVLNALLIVAAETTGEFFHATGLIHGFALFFIVLAGTRIFRRYDVYDPELRIYMRYALAAMTVFAVSHLVELFSIVVLKNYEDATFATAVALYAVSLLLLMAGSASLNRNIRKTSYAPIAIAWASMGALGLFIVAMLSERVTISLEPDGPTPYVLAAGLTVLSVAAIVQAVRIARHYVSYASFFRHMVVVTVLVSAAAYQYVFYEAIEDLGIPEHRVIYLSHYFFYAAISAMYLAFGASLRPRGVFEDVRKFIDQTDSPLEKKGEK